MTEEQVFRQIVNKIDWLFDIAKRKNWTVKLKPFVDRPATIEEITEVEVAINMEIPGDFKRLFLLSRRLEFNYQFDETLPDEFSHNFSGEIYWNLSTLADQYAHFRESIETLLDPKYNDPDTIELTGKIWRNKLPFMNVTNGDIIAIGNSPSEIVYFSHEGDKMHGKILGDNLWAFLDFYSRIGFAGSEDWQLEPFFDFERNVMITQGDKIDRYNQLLEK